MDVSNLLKTLRQAASSPDVQTSITESERQSLYQACENLSTCLETPCERLMRTSYDFISPMIIRIAIDIGIFELLNNDNEPDRVLGVSEIATHTKTDQALICRVMRFLIMHRIFDVTTEGKCKANNSTKSFQPQGDAHDTVILLSGVLIPLFARLPVYLRHNGYKVPENANNGPFQDAFATNFHLYDWFSQKQVEQDAFHRSMATSPGSGGHIWTQNIPEKWILERFPSEDACCHKSIFVDIGASSGYVLNALMLRLPNLHPRLIVQDLPELTKEKPQCAATDEGQMDMSHPIEKMGHNFFDAQPVQGASIYILARVLHNWPDKEALLILQHTQAAMNHKSTLLIYDCVFSDRLDKISYDDAMSDMTMMAGLSSWERTEGQWRSLLSSAGLRLMSVWRGSSTDSSEAVLEVVRQDSASV